MTRACSGEASGAKPPSYEEILSEWRAYTKKHQPRKVSVAEFLKHLATKRIKAPGPRQLAKILKPHPPKK